MEITVTGNTGWTTCATSKYTLSISSSNYQGSVSGNVTIKPATPTVSGIITGGEFFEDRITNNDIIGNAEASVPGEFLVTTPLVYTGPEANSTYDTITVEWVFNPTDTTNYKVVEGSVNIQIKPVAYVGSTYYGTLDKAIAATGSGTIVVIPGTNPIIKTDGLNISAGVTLFIPHTAGSTVKSSGIAEFENGDIIATSDPGTYLKNTVRIIEEITLTNNGKIEIAGQIASGNGGSQYSGHTGGLYTRILLESNAELVNNGTINCYGYIEEASLNNGSQLTTNEGGRIYIPFILRDFYGGSVMYPIYKNIDEYNMSAFNQFEFRNITCISKINYGGSVVSWANLYANDQQNYTTIQTIGTENSIINLTDSTYSYATIKYNPNTEIHDLDIYGGASASSMKLKINVGFSVSISTDQVFFPLSWRYDISLNKAQGQAGEAMYSMPQSYKLMTGARFSVEAGANLYIEKLAIYETFIDELSNDNGKLAVTYPNKEPAVFTVNGKVTAGSLGGTVYTNSASGAQLAVTTTPLTTYEPLKTSGSGFLAQLKDKQTLNHELKLKMYENGSVNSTATVQSAGVYLSNSGGWELADNLNKFTINFETGVDNIEVNPMTIYSENTSYTINEDYLQEPVYKYYTFLGWFYKNANNELVSADNYVLNAVIPDGKETGEASITLYADWAEASLDITYMIEYQDCISTELINDSPTSYGLSNPATLKAPTDGNLTFVGWYLDPEYTIKINEITTNMGGYGLEDIVLYGYFTSKPTYTITFQDNRSEAEFTDLNPIEVIEGGTTKVLDYNTSNLHPIIQTNTFPYYFGGWYTTSTYDEGTEFISDETTVTSDLTLYAKWLDKVVITTVAGDNAPAGYTVTNGTTESKLYFFPNAESLAGYKVAGTNKSFVSGNNLITQQYYFNGWKANDQLLNGTTLTTEQINSAISNGKLEVSGDWKSKVAVTLNLTGDITQFTYDEVKYDANTTYYFLAGDTFTVSGSYNSTSNSKRNPTEVGLSENITKNELIGFIVYRGNFEATYTVQDNVSTASLSCSF